MSFFKLKTSDLKIITSILFLISLLWFFVHEQVLNGMGFPDREVVGWMVMWVAPALLTQFALSLVYFVSSWCLFFYGVVFCFLCQVAISVGFFPK